MWKAFLRQLGKQWKLAKAWNQTEKSLNLTLVRDTRWKTYVFVNEILKSFEEFPLIKEFL